MKKLFSEGRFASWKQKSAELGLKMHKVLQEARFIVLHQLAPSSRWRISKSESVLRTRLSGGKFSFVSCYALVSGRKSRTCIECSKFRGARDVYLGFVYLGLALMHPHWAWLWLLEQGSSAQVVVTGLKTETRLLSWQLWPQLSSDSAAVAVVLLACSDECLPENKTL